MKQKKLAKLTGTWQSCYLQLHKPLQNKWTFTRPRALKNTYWNVTLKWSQHELRAVLYNYHPITPSSNILFSSIPLSLSLSPKQSTSTKKHHNTSISLVYLPHLAIDHHSVQSSSAHSGSGKQTIWPSGVSNTVLHPLLAFTSLLITYFNSPTLPSSVSIIF